MPDRHNNEIQTVAVNDRGASNDWPALLSRMVDDISRIVGSELRLFEANLVGHLNATVERAIAGMLLIACSVVGGVCLLIALILLLHEWLPWWESVGLVGLLVMGIGLGAYAAMMPRRNALETR
jgi:hypothetical protein